MFGLGGDLLLPTHPQTCCCEHVRNTSYSIWNNPHITYKKSCRSRSIQVELGKVEGLCHVNDDVIISDRVRIYWPVSSRVSWQNFVYKYCVKLYLQYLWLLLFIREKNNNYYCILAIMFINFVFNPTHFSFLSFLFLNHFFTISLQSSTTLDLYFQVGKLWNIWLWLSQSTE